jgi:hypothetical protein
MNYLLLAIPSAIETQRLIEDFTEHPDEALHTPHWGNAVHVSLITAVTDPPAVLSESVLSESMLSESMLSKSMGAARR